MNQPQYKIYATLLDAFSWYQASESDHAEQEFLDKINRVPITDEKALERMNKGTELNNLIDVLLMDSPVNLDTCGFDKVVVSELYAYLIGSTQQHYTEIYLEGLNTLLYGYIDYVKENKCIDLKSTSSYDLGKYKGSMQRHVYPISLAGEGIMVDEFEFLVTDFKSVFKETYPVNLEESNAVLTEQVQLLIDFLESKRHLITDQKIFGLI